MSNMFSNCSSLVSLSRIKQWNIFKVRNMNHMFYGCLSLSFIPDKLKELNFNNIDSNYIYDDCNNCLNIYH